MSGKGVTVLKKSIDGDVQARIWARHMEGGHGRLREKRGVGQRNTKPSSQFMGKRSPLQRRYGGNNLNPIIKKNKQWA